MKRSRFSQGEGSPHIFGPSVNEIWSRHGNEILFYRSWEEGFYCVYVDQDRTTNFNFIDSNFHDVFKYVRTVDQKTVDEILQRYQQRVIKRELSLA